MPDCLCCGLRDTGAGLFMAIGINPAERRACNNCARTGGLNLERNRALRDAYDHGDPPQHWMRQCLPINMAELGGGKTLARVIELSIATKVVLDKERVAPLKRLWCASR